MEITAPTQPIDIEVARPPGPKPSRVLPKPKPLPPDRPPKDKPLKPITTRGDLAAEQIPFEHEKAWGEWIRESPTMRSACEDFGFYKMLRGNGQINDFRKGVEADTQASNEWQTAIDQATAQLDGEVQCHAARNFLESAKHF